MDDADRRGGHIDFLPFVYTDTDLSKSEISVSGLRSPAVVGAVWGPSRGAIGRLAFVPDTTGPDSRFGAPTGDAVTRCQGPVTDDSGRPRLASWVNAKDPIMQSCSSQRSLTVEGRRGARAGVLS